MQLARGITAVVAAAFGIVTPASGQSGWLASPARHGARVEIQSPNYDNADWSLGTFTTFVTGFYRLTEKTTAIVEVPLNRTEGPATSRTFVGNPFVGVEISDGSSTMMEMGARLPLSNGGSVIGLSDLGRLGSFGPDLISVHWIGSAWRRDEAGYFVRLRGGLQALVGTNGGGGDLWAILGGYNGFDLDWLRVVLGVNGIGVITIGGLGFDDRTLWEIGGAVEVRRGPVHFGGQVRFPLDREMRSLLDVVYGISLTVGW